MTPLTKTEILLLRYAAGSLNAAQSVTVIVLLVFSKDMRLKVAEFEALGGQLLQEEMPAFLSADCLEIVLQKIDSPPQPQGRFRRFWALVLRQ